MRGLIITEEEKRNILNKHINGYNPKNYYNLYEEKRNILKLMNLTEGVNPTKITELLGFEKLGKMLGPGMSETILKNIGDYSAGLRKLGINSLEELDAAARAWQQTNQKDLAKTLEGSDLLSAFLKTSSFIGEISLEIISRESAKIDASALKAIEDLSTAMGTYVNKSGIEGDIGVGVKISDDISSEALTISETAITVLEKKLDETIKKVEKELTDSSAYIKTLPLKQQAAYVAGQKTYRDIIEALKEVKIKLAEQKVAIQAAKEQQDYIRTIEGDVIVFNGKTWRAYEMGGLRKLLITKGVDTYPFIYAVCTYIRQFFITKCFSDVMFDNIAKLQQLQKLLSESSGDASQKIIDEINIFSRETSSLITMLNGKKLVIDGSYLPKKGSIWNEIMGIGGTDLANTWKQIVNILNEQVKKGVITDAEMTQILDNIKYAYSQGGSEVGGKMEYNLIGDAGNIRGLFKFKEDLMTQGKNAGMDLTNNVKMAVEKSKSNAVTPLERTWKYIYDNVYKSAAGITKQSFKKALAGFFLREFIFGLPLNIRYYLKPLTKYGFNVKGILMTYLKLLLAKTIGSFVFGAIGAVAYHAVLMTGLVATGLTQEDAEALAWADFNKELENYKDMDLTKIVNIATLGGIDINTEYGERRANKEKYKENVTRELGPFKIKFEEIWEEIWSILRTNPDKGELAEFAKQQEQKIQTNTEKKIEELKTEAFYTLTPEQQNETTRIDEWPEQFDKSTQRFGGDKEKLKSRLFVKAEFSGLPDLNPDISDAQKIKAALSNIDDYGYKVCLCKKDLKYEEKQIKIGDETKIAKIPVCRDFVRLIYYRPKNFLDREELNKNPKTTGNLSPLNYQIGYIDGSTVLDAAPISKQFYLLDNFKKYLN